MIAKRVARSGKPRREGVTPPSAGRAGERRPRSAGIGSTLAVFEVSRTEIKLLSCYAG